MRDNILTDIAWIHTVSGRKTVRDTLIHAHEPRMELDSNIAGFYFSAQLRFLTQVLAVILRYTTLSAQELRREGIPVDAVDKAIAMIDDGAHLRSGKYPFMQPNEDIPVTAKVKSLAKLPPSVPTANTENFWNMTAIPESLSVEDATLWVATYGIMAPCSNNTLNKELKLKAENGAPGFRFNLDKTPAEVIYEGNTLLTTLMFMTKKSWVKDESLPAWADRVAEHGQGNLWRGSWMSNAVILEWNDDDELISAGVGGITKTSWYPQKDTHPAPKEWWDERDKEDIFYQYYLKTSNKEEDPKPQLAYFSVDETLTELSVQWMTNTYPEVNHERVLNLSRPSVTLVQHDLSGTATTPKIYASVVTRTDPTTWVVAENESSQTLRVMKSMGKYINATSSALKYVIKNEDKLSALETDLLYAFWSELDIKFRALMLSARNEGTSVEDLYKKIRQVAFNAFDMVYESVALVDPAVTYGARSYLTGILFKKEKELLEQ